MNYRGDEIGYIDTTINVTDNGLSAINNMDNESFNIISNNNTALNIVNDNGDELNIYPNGDISDGDKKFNLFDMMERIESLETLVHNMQSMLPRNISIISNRKRYVV